MFKIHSPKHKNQAYLPLFLLLLPLTVYAFSVGSIFGYFKNDSDTRKKVDAPGNENLQSMKVFEPNKVFAEGNMVEPIKKEIALTNSIAFETGQEFIDDLDNGSHEGHGENAIYTVQKGDSIYSIADYFDLSPSTIMTYNHKDVITVRVGDILEIPNVDGILYKVKKGDTLSKIASKYSIQADDVTLYNGLLSSDDLAIGEEIFLPNAKSAVSPTSNLAKNPSKKNPSNIASVPGTNILSYKPSSYAKGDTSHLNTVSGIKKFMSLPKYDGYYTFPAPGSVRTQKMHGHNGVDLANKLGSPVLASADGVVKVAKTGGYNFGYGNYIIISHSNGSESLYGHLARVDVTVGESVSKGIQIGTVGSTGNSTGPHLHFEIRGAYNPFAW